MIHGSFGLCALLGVVLMLGGASMTAMLFLEDVLGFEVRPDRIVEWGIGLTILAAILFYGTGCTDDSHTVEDVNDANRARCVRDCKEDRATYVPVNYGGSPTCFCEVR